MGTETASTPQNGLSSLFLSNQPTQMAPSGMLPTITAPQPLIGNVDLSALSSMRPVNYTPPAAPAPPAPPVYNSAPSGGDTDTTFHPYAPTNALGLGAAAFKNREKYGGR